MTLTTSPKVRLSALLLATLPLAGGTGILLAAPAHAAVEPALAAAVAAATRTPANALRDRHRHPAETLDFFGVKPTDTVVEIWPAGGWYTEILAPYLKDRGTLWGADFWPDSLRGIRTLQEKDPALYGKVKLAAFPAAGADPTVPAGTADVVLTFRNVHNWQMGYRRNNAPYAVEAFQQMFAMLKPGGILGIVDHRLPEAADTARERTSGYVKVSTVRKFAEDAGFEFVGSSEVNANIKDTADYPKGVWTLPPRYAEGDVDRAKYEAIGESDRMTLKFRKPKR